MPNHLPPLLVARPDLVVAACSGASLRRARPAGRPAERLPEPPAPGRRRSDGASDRSDRHRPSLRRGWRVHDAGFAASQVPIFTLYGDGTVVFRTRREEMPPLQGSVMRTNPLRTAKLSEDQIQDLLVYALGDGGLASARDQYDNPMVTDAAPRRSRSMRAGSRRPWHLCAGAWRPPGADGHGPRRAFGELAERLADFDQGGAIATDVYQPAGVPRDPDGRDRHDRPERHRLALEGHQAVRLQGARRSERLPARDTGP